MTNLEFSSYSYNPQPVSILFVHLSLVDEKYVSVVPLQVPVRAAKLSHRKKNETLQHFHSYIYLKSSVIVFCGRSNGRSSLYVVWYCWTVTSLRVHWSINCTLSMVHLAKQRIKRSRTFCQEWCCSNFQHWPIVCWCSRDDFLHHSLQEAC